MTLLEIEADAEACACCSCVPDVAALLAIAVETRSVDLPAARVPICADCLAFAVAVRLEAARMASWP